MSRRRGLQSGCDKKGTDKKYLKNIKKYKNVKILKIKLNEKNIFNTNIKFCNFKL